VTDETDTSSAEGDISLLDLALVLAENLRSLVLVPLAAGFAALGFAFTITPTYTATVRILPPLQQQSTSAVIAAQLGALAGLAGTAGAIRNPVDQYLAVLRSVSLLDAMIERFKLRDPSKEQYMVDVRRSLAGRTKISANLKDGIITIGVDDQDPKRAAEMANAYVEELRNLLQTLAITEAAQRRLFFETQLNRIKDNLTKSEIALRGSGISEATLKTMPASALEALARIRAQITAQEVRIASMRSSMTDSNPVFQVALQELAALRAELSKAEKSDSVQAVGEGADYIEKFREFKYHETLFELMARQYELARIDEAREGTVIQVLDAARPPERKSAPKKAVIAVLTTLVMFFVMIFFVFVRHAFWNISKDHESAEKLRRLRQLLLLRRA